MLEGQSKQIQRKSRKSLRRLAVAVFDAALEQWPVFKPLWIWLKQEVTGLKQGYVLFVVLALAFGAVVGWSVHHWDVVQKNIESKNVAAASSTSTVAAGRDDLEFMELYKHSPLELANHSKEDFEKNDFVGAIKFFEAAEDADEGAIDSNQTWMNNQLFYAGALLIEGRTNEANAELKKIIEEATSATKPIPRSPSPIIADVLYTDFARALFFPKWDEMSAAVNSKNPELKRRYLDPVRKRLEEIAETIRTQEAKKQ